EKYIEALAASIQPFLEHQYDHVLFSYHGIPERHVKKTDLTKSHCLMVNDCCNKSSEAHKYCYRHQVKTTTEKAAEVLKLPKEKYS
ncbi:ferrochelatase, partial [Klebsiella pneumoniae]|uniref:ferrochelatase n=1 Tax=Klebsiella pneumoniae TaxID=573 RepID=UPI003851D2FF